jgi:hypothetical protein
MNPAEAQEIKGFLGWLESYVELINYPHAVLCIDLGELINCLRITVFSIHAPKR